MKNYTKNYFIASLIIIGLIAFSVFNFEPTGQVLKNSNEKTGSIYVLTTPLGAEVFVDDTFKGITPIHMNYIGYGIHNIRIEKNGYMTEERTIKMNQNKRPLKIEVTLKPEL